jgi:selenocysteine-specific elongation factor
VRLRLGAREFSALIPTWLDVRPAGGLVALSGFAPAMTPELQAAADAYVEALRSSPSGTAGRAIDPELLGHLVERGVVVDAGDGAVFEASAFAAMTKLVLAHIDTHGSITLAEARDAIGLGRRYVQSVLEHMDRMRLTRRVGDRRVRR